MKLFETSRQAPLFIVFICAGIILGVIYDILYVFRCKRRPIIMAIGDILFSAIFFIIMVYFITKFNSGAPKIFMFFAVFLGFCAERFSLGNFIKIFIDFFVKILYNLCRRLNIKKYLKMLLK